MTTAARLTNSQDDRGSQKFSTIFSNLGTGRNVYVANVGWDVAGPQSGVMEQSVAMPFKPRFNAEVTRIIVAVEHEHGIPNSFVLSLNEDGSEISTPGKQIHAWMIKDAPSFGTCCILDMARVGKDINVKRGVQYWVIVTTNAREAETHFQWNLSPKGIESNFSINNGQGWFEYTAFTSAFAVFGEKTD